MYPCLPGLKPMEMKKIVRVARIGRACIRFLLCLNKCTTRATPVKA